MLSNTPDNIFLQKLLAKIALRCPGGALPSTYLVWDTETGGADIYEDRIVQFGFCFVMNGEVCDRMSFYVKRPLDFKMHPKALAAHGITVEKLQAEGLEPAEAFGIVHQLFTNWRAAGHMFMGHNVMAFDTPMFELEAKLLGLPWHFNENEQIDTGMIVKGTRLPFYINDNDSLRSYYVRVSEVVRRGLFWSLDRYCIDAYNLHAHGVDPKAAHDASNDCYATHCLFKELNSGIA